MRTKQIWKLLFIIIILIGSIGISSAEERKYPPYPDVWGYELPWPNVSRQVFIYKMPDGDFAVAYKQDKDVGDKYIIKYFFSGQEMYLTEKEYTEFKKKDKRGGENKIVLKNGDTIRLSRYGVHIKECQNAFTDVYFYKTNTNGRVVFKKMPFYLHDKPKIIPLIDLYDLRICGGHGVLSMMIENLGRTFEPLDDGGFLFFSTSGGFIIRFDKNLHTKSRLMNQKVFFMDRDFFMKNFYKKQKLGNLAEPYQALHDALLEYLLNVKKNTKTDD
jgi:hypothetical protein